MYEIVPEQLKFMSEYNNICLIEIAALIHRHVCMPQVVK